MSPRVDWSIKVRDVLTTLTIAISVAALRKTATQYRSELRTETQKVIQPMRDYLFDVISKTDDEVLGAARQAT